MAMSSEWRSDVLGADFEQATLYPPDGAEATLIRHVPSTGAPDGGGAEARPVAVLYLHGFNDYFFHPHVAEALAGAGYAFYAVDLRGFGRSMAAHVEVGGDPNMARSIAVYAADLDAAASAIRERGHQKLVVMAHSMGGLVATLWASGAKELRGAGSTNRLRADALVLNAPWFDLNESDLLRGPGTELIGVLSNFAPRAAVGGIKPFYGRALHRETGGEWAFNLDWKPPHGFPVQAAWLTSIRQGQRRLMSGLVRLDIPVLVLASTRSGSAKQWHPEVITTDSVLNVRDIALGAAQIGDRVTFVQIPGGAHDLALSREAARKEYLATVIDWLTTTIPAS